MKEFNVTQGTPEWHELRLGVPTASEFDALMTPEFALRTGETPKTFLYKKVAEHLTGPLPQWSGNATDQGHFLEPEAVPFFEMETGLDVRKVGFILADGARCGCSPDGLIGDDSGLEIKCPGALNHTRYFCEGALPKAYVAQVHGSMFVTGRTSWHFMSYHRKLPPFHLIVKRDEAVMALISKALTKFYADFDATRDRMTANQLAA